MTSKRNRNGVRVEFRVSENLRDLFTEEAKLLGLERSKFLALAGEKYCNTMKLIRKFGLEDHLAHTKKSTKKSIKKIVNENKDDIPSLLETVIDEQQQIANIREKLKLETIEKKPIEKNCINIKRRRKNEEEVNISVPLSSLSF